MPLFVQDNKKAFVGALKRFIQIPAYICSLVMMILIVIAKPLIILLYSAKWVDCVSYFQILCVAGLAVCLQGSANNSIAAIGKSNVFFIWTIIKRSLTIILCVVGIFVAGMNGLLWSCVAGAWAVYFINAYLVHRYVGYNFLNQVLDILPSILLAVVIGAVAYYLGTLLSINMYLIALLQAVFCTFGYLGVSWLLRLDAYRYLLDVGMKRLHRSKIE